MSRLCEPRDGVGAAGGNLAEKRMGARTSSEIVAPISQDESEFGNYQTRSKDVRYL